MRSTHRKAAQQTIPTGLIPTFCHSLSRLGVGRFLFDYGEHATRTVTFRHETDLQLLSATPYASLVSVHHSVGERSAMPVRQCPQRIATMSSAPAPPALCPK